MALGLDESFVDHPVIIGGTNEVARDATVRFTEGGEEQKLPTQRLDKRLDRGKLRVDSPFMLADSRAGHADLAGNEHLGTPADFAKLFEA